MIFRLHRLELAILLREDLIYEAPSEDRGVHDMQQDALRVVLLRKAYGEAGRDTEVSDQRDRMQNPHRIEARKRLWDSGADDEDRHRNGPEQRVRDAAENLLPGRSMPMRPDDETRCMCGVDRLKNDLRGNPTLQHNGARNTAGL